MAVGWIDNIYNNTRAAWFLRSVDSRNNGELTNTRTNGKFTLDDGKFKQLNPSTQYRASWCGIPWYYNGQHFKAFSSSSSAQGVQFFTSELEGKNWIMYVDGATGRTIARQAAPKGSDFHCTMRVEADGVFIDIVNNNEFSGENALFMILNEAKEWAKVLNIGALLLKVATGGK
ncbi:MAG: hypothetical protein JWQ99_1896 [Blastococcus sp.]|jgi:hypothetical protein|nr:hypothetical protein [Blastococcus sp.]